MRQGALPPGVGRSGGPGGSGTGQYL